MAFSALFQFSPKDEAGKGRWLLEHYLEHMQFYRALLAQGVITVNYPLERMDNDRDWLAAHNEESQSVWSGIGGGQSTDFGSVNWDDQNAADDWHNLHQLWHKQVRDALGL